MNSQKNTTLKPTDPVCGMQLPSRQTNIITTVNGKTYHFCAENCRKIFEKNPQKYLGSKRQKPKGLWGRYMDRLQKATGGRAQKCH